MAAFKLKVLSNPYPHTIPDVELYRMLDEIATNLHVEVFNRYGSGEFKRNSLGLCLMNPTAPRSTPPQNAILALLAVGLEGPDFLPNGVGKAFEHWQHGEDCGTLAYVKPYLLPDGSFVYGHSVDVEGTIVGASGATEAQDRFLATCFGAEFNYRVTDARKAWRAENPDSKWFCDQNLPDKAFTAAAQLLDDPEVGLLF
jgi:hypothetical protein